MIVALLEGTWVMASMPCRMVVQIGCWFAMVARAATKDDNVVLHLAHLLRQYLLEQCAPRSGCMVLSLHRLHCLTYLNCLTELVSSSKIEANPF